MYTPIFEIAAARGWKASPQSHFKARVKIKQEWKGTSRYVDFVFYHASRKPGSDVAAVEVSYINEDSKLTKIKRDMGKLKAFKSHHFARVERNAMNRYILIAAKQDCLAIYCYQSRFETRHNCLRGW